MIHPARRSPLFRPLPTAHPQAAPAAPAARVEEQPPAALPRAGADGEAAGVGEQARGALGDGVQRQPEPGVRVRAPAPEAVLAPDEDGVAHGLLGHLGDPPEGPAPAAPALTAARLAASALATARLADEALVQRPPELPRPLQDYPRGIRSRKNSRTSPASSSGTSIAAK